MGGPSRRRLVMSSNDPNPQMDQLSAVGRDSRRTPELPGNETRDLRPWNRRPATSMMRCMNCDRNGLEVLSRHHCLELLSKSKVGRVIFTENALPAALPVNFAVLDQDV